MKPTEEQNKIIECLKNNDGLVAIKAYAGCGKTSTLQLAVAELKPKKGLYTAFNSSIVKEAEEKFPASINCQTQHAFALSYVRPKKDIQEFSYHDIEEPISYTNKKLVISAIDNFYRSSSIDMYQYFDEVLEQKYLADLAIKYVDKMINEDINPTFNYLLKYLHLMLVEGTIEINYDIVLYDECQDAVAVMLEIVKLIKAPKKVLVGDTHQNIYAYMKTVNAFKLLDVPTFELTRSFRCSPEIADKVDTFGKHYLDKDFVYKGTKTKGDNTFAYISRTNASIINRMHTLHAENKSYTLTRSIKDIFAGPIAIVTAARGKKVYKYKYKYLETEYKNFCLSNYKSFYSYLLQHVDDREIKAAINLLMSFNKKGINIFDVKKKAESIKPNPNIYIVTAHSFKGREVDSVYIEDDLNKSIIDIVFEGGPSSDEDIQEFNLAYVAVTRAKNKICNCKFLA